MSVEELTSLLNCPMPDGYVIKAIHLYLSKVNLTLVKNSHMKTQALTYEEFYNIFGV